LAKPPAPGQDRSKEKKLDKIDVTEWTLSNGAPRDRESRPTTSATAWLLTADSPGGTALAKDKDYNDARFAATVVGLGGVADSIPTPLGKVLAGSRSAASAAINEVSEGLNASASSKDLETMFQLLTCASTAPRKDEEQFHVWQANNAEQLANRSARRGVQYFKSSARRSTRTTCAATSKPDDFGRSISTRRSRSTRIGSATSRTSRS